MRWSQRDAVLHGSIGASESLADLRRLTCTVCASRFESIVLHLDDLGSVDSDDLQAAGAFLDELDTPGGIVSIRTNRPALQRLLLAGPLGPMVDTNPHDDSGPGEPHTCPHR